MGDYVDPGQGRIKGRGHKQRKTRVVKKETYSRKDFRGHPNGNEIYDHVTKLIEEEKVEGGKKESIYCTVYKYLQANARKSFIHERTPDLGQDGMGTKETLAVLLSISTKDVDTILGNAGTELKVDVFAEVGEGECKMLRFPIKYYTTAEDLTTYVLKDLGITDSVLNYQIAIVKTPYKGKSKLKAMMCAGGATSPYPGSNKSEKVLYPHEHPLQILDSKLRVVESKDIPKLQSCYFHVTMRPMEQLTVYYRRIDGVVQEDMFTLQPSITCHELIEQCVEAFELKNDIFAYKLVMKAFEFDEETLPRDQQPLVAISLVEDYQDGYPQLWLEDQEVSPVVEVLKQDIKQSFHRKHSSRRGSRKKIRATVANGDHVSSEDDADTGTEINRIQQQLHQASQRRKTQSSKDIGLIKEQESILQQTLLEQDKVISALSSAVSTAEHPPVKTAKSPEMSTKRKADPADFENKLKATLAEKQTQIWELEDNQEKYNSTVQKLEALNKELLERVHALEDEIRTSALASKHALDTELREKKDLEKEVQLLRRNRLEKDGPDSLVELQLQIEKDQALIEQQKVKISDLIHECEVLGKKHGNNNRLEVDGMQKSISNDSMSIIDFNEWSKNLDELKKKNDKLLGNNKQLTNENNGLKQTIKDIASEQREIEALRADNIELSSKQDELITTLHNKEDEIQILNERLNGADAMQMDDFQEKYYQMYEKNQRLESVMTGTIEKLKSKISLAEDEKVSLQNHINDLETDLSVSKRNLKDLDYMKNRVEMMEMEHLHLKEFSSQLIEENKAIAGLNESLFVKDQQISELNVIVRGNHEELVKLRGLAKMEVEVQVDDPYIPEMEEKLEEALGRVESRNLIVESMNKKISSKEDEISSLKNMISDYQSTSEMTATQLDKLTKQNATLGSKIVNKNEEISNFKMIMDAINEDLHSTKQLCEDNKCPSALKLTTALETKDSDLSVLQQDSQAEASRISDLTSQLTDARSTVAQFEHSLGVAMQERDEVLELSESLDKSLKEKENKVKELMELIACLRDEVDAGKNKVEEITSKRNELNKELIQTKQQSAEVESECKEQTDRANKFQKKFKQSMDEINALKDLNDALTASLEEMQSNDCSKGQCAKVMSMAAEMRAKDTKHDTLLLEIEDLKTQRKDLQNALVSSKNALAEQQIETEEVEASLLKAQETCEEYKMQIKSLQRKLDPKKKRDHVDNLENQLEMYKIEVASIKSVTRALEDDIERMSMAEIESGDEVARLTKANCSLDIQLGDAKGEINDLNEQLEKFKQSLSEAQDESSQVELYLGERDMLKGKIGQLEEENSELTHDIEGREIQIQALKEELSIIKGVREIQTKDATTSKHEVSRLKATIAEKEEELALAQEELHHQEQEKLRQVEIIERHKNRSIESDIRISELKSELEQARSGAPLSNGGEDIMVNIKKMREDSEQKQQSLDELNEMIGELSNTVTTLRTENKSLEASILELDAQDTERSGKVEELEQKFHADVEALEGEYKEKMSTLSDQVKLYINENKALKEELLLIEVQREDLQKNTRIDNSAESAVIQEAVLRANEELEMERQLNKSVCQKLDQAKEQLEHLENELVETRKKVVTSDKQLETLQAALAAAEAAGDELKQSCDELKTADENKRREIRLLNTMINEYSEKAEEAEGEYASLRSKYKERKVKLEDLQKDMATLKSQNQEYENVIVALESTSSSDNIDTINKSKRIEELKELLDETEDSNNETMKEYEKAKEEMNSLREENEQLVEEIKTYQAEWQKLTSLLNTVNHTNSANMDSCQRLETKLDLIEDKVTTTNVHIDICEGDMFSKTEALVRDNALLEQKISESMQSLKQSENFVKDSHDNIAQLQDTIQELREKVQFLEEVIRENKEKEEKESGSVEMERELRGLRNELADTQQLLTEAKAERQSDESAFKVSLDTIVRSYEEQIRTLEAEKDKTHGKMQKLNKKLKDYEDCLR